MPQITVKFNLFHVNQRDLYLHCRVCSFMHLYVVSFFIILVSCWVILHAVLSSAEFYMFFFFDNFQKIFQKYHRSNSLDPGQTTCWASSGSKLFADQQTAKSVMS